MLVPEIVSLLIRELLITTTAARTFDWLGRPTTVPVTVTVKPSTR